MSKEDGLFGAENFGDEFDSDEEEEHEEDHKLTSKGQAVDH